MDRKLVRGLLRVYKLSGEMKKGKVNLRNLPIRVWIEPTNSCNLKCIMCPQRTNKEKRGFMDINLYKKIIDEAKGIAIDVNLFLGGEPLLHPRIIDMIKYTKSRGLRVRVETNATLLTKKISSEIIKAGTDFISFSFDGYTKEDYEKIRVGGKYEKTLENIINFLKIKKAMRARKPYTLIQVIEIAPLREKNKKIKKTFFNLFKGLPVNDFRVVVPHRFGGKIEEKITGNKYAYVKEGRVKYSPCPYLWTSMNILWDGRIVPCCVDFWGQYEIGNANKTSLKDAWNSSRMMMLRKKILDKKYKEIGLCKDCDFLWQKTFLGVSKKNIKDLLIFLKENMSS